MFVYSLEDVSRSKHYRKDRTFVLTESEDVVKVNELYGYAQVLRPLERRDYQTSVVKSVQEAVQLLEWDYDIMADVVCVVYANCPNREPDTIDLALEMVLEDGRNSVRTYNRFGLETGNVWAYRNGSPENWYTYTGAIFTDALEIHTQADLDIVTAQLRDRFFREHPEIFGGVSGA